MSKRNCSNCHKEIKYESRSDLMFCSVKCHCEFMNRDSDMRKKLGWNQLKEM